MIHHNQHPNIIVLILDAVRAKNLSVYQNSGATTNFLEELAEESILFRNAYSTSTWTIPTHASMLSGLYLSQHGIESTQADRSFNKEIKLLPDILRRQGYQTAAFSQNMLFSPKYFIDHEFEIFCNYDGLSHSGNKRPGGKIQLNGLMEKFRRFSRYFDKVSRLRLFLDKLTERIEESTDPIFLMCNITNAHYPWAPSPKLLLRKVGVRKLLSAFQEKNFTLKPFQYNSGKMQITPGQREMWELLYEAAVLHVEQEVGKFIRKLKKWDQWQNTIVVVTSDHGEMLGEHRDIVGHTLTLHDNLLHVPLIVRHPDYPKGNEINGVVQNMDIFSSAVEWSGYSAQNLPDAQMYRPSLSVSVADPRNSGGYAFAEEDYTDSYNVLNGLQKVNPSFDINRFPHQQKAVRSAFWKYIWRDDGIEEFYNMQSDPEEKVNLAVSDDVRYKSCLNEHRRALVNWQASLTSFPPQVSSESSDISEEVRVRLRELGYLE